MKKLISLFMTAVMVFAVCTLAGCGEKSGDMSSKDEVSTEKLRFGMGVCAYSSAITSADQEAVGNAESSVIGAAVLVDKQEKIVNCYIDAMDSTLNFSSGGQAEASKEVKSKYELGDEYGMVAYGKAKMEWYEQVDAFVKLCKGKTLDEVKKLSISDGKGNDEVVKAGCTITISDFVKAIEKAFSNLKKSEATESDTLKIGMAFSQTDVKNATAEASGTNGFEVTVCASVLDNDKRIVDSVIDTAAFKVTFDAEGVTEDTPGDITTKRELGDAYGMELYGKADKEWYEQVDIFAKSLVSKNANEISELVTESGYGVTEVQTAGCTIAVGDMVKAAIKAAS